jgi:threonine aldolase
MKTTYDLRSDTVTRPTAAMRKAIAEAPVGDDVYHEDPTVNALEERSANLTGKEAALFVTSGSMGNLLSLYINGGRGNEVLAHRHSHIIEHEVGSPAAIAGVLPIGLDGERGLLSAAALSPHLYPRDYASAAVGLIEVENTTNGTCYPLETLKEIYQLADFHNIPVHMDGARLMNAAVAGGVKPAEICRHADTVSFCLSKGLGTPAGSMLCGSAVFIEKARKVRKMLGGGMRQAGILAAAGLHALEHHIDRLAEDHCHASLIAAELARTSWAEIKPAEVETNIVIFTTPLQPAEEVVEQLNRAGILCFSVGPDRIRMVTHLDLSAEDIEAVCRIIRELKPR